MSQCICFEKALSNSVLLTEVVVGQGSGLDFTKTLHLLRALGMVNSTIRPNPSSCRDSVARAYSASAMAFADLFPRRKLRKVTTGPWATRTWSLIPSRVGCSIVLSQVALVISFRN